jgi:hypothetical protein
MSLAGREEVFSFFHGTGALDWGELHRVAPTFQNGILSGPMYLLIV